MMLLSKSQLTRIKDPRDRDLLRGGHLPNLFMPSFFASSSRRFFDPVE